MKLYILTNQLNESGYCNEYKPKVFNTYEEAYSDMEKHYLHTTTDDKALVIEHEIASMDAYILYADDEVEYYRIWEVEV